MIKTQCLYLSLIILFSIGCKGKSITKGDIEVSESFVTSKQTGPSIEEAQGKNKSDSNTSTLVELPEVTFAEPSEDLQSTEQVVEVSWNPIEIANILFESKICSENDCDGECKDQFKSVINKRQVYLNKGNSSYVCVRSLHASETVSSDWAISKKISLYTGPQNIEINQLNMLDRTTATDTILATLSTDIGSSPDLVVFEILATEDTDSEYFEIVDGNSVVLSQNLDSVDASKEQLILEIRATDSLEKVITEKFTFPIGMGNPSPFDIELTSTTITENQGPTLIANINVADDIQDSHTLELVDEADKALFEIIESQLYSRVSFNYEELNSYEIGIRAIDSAGQAFEKNFTIAINDQNETVSNINFLIKDTNGSFPEGTEVIEATLLLENIQAFEYEFDIILRTDSADCYGDKEDFQLTRGDDPNVLNLSVNTVTRISRFDFAITVTYDNQMQTFTYEYVHDGTKMNDNCRDN